MNEEEDKIAWTINLPEVIVTPKGAYTTTRTEYLRNYYLSISGDVYDRNPDLFRKAIRFMQKNRDLKGESQIFNRCLNAATNRVARQFVLPVLLGAVALPVILEAGPVVGLLYKGPGVGLRMGVNWSVQALTKGIREVDYVSVVAEGFTVGGSAVSALIECRPWTKEHSAFTIGFIDKSFEDTSVDIVTRALGAVFFNFTSNMVTEFINPGNDIWVKNIIRGMGTYFYTEYHLISASITEGVIKKEIEARRLRNETVGRSE